jgi:transcriptional regulator with XRE-family HTH domain
MARGLKQKDVAKTLNLKSSGIISRWEKGICMPSSLNIFKLAALYRTMADALFIDLIRKLKEKILKREEEALK